MMSSSERPTSSSLATYLMSLVEELKDALASQEQYFVRETRIRQGQPKVGMLFGEETGPPQEAEAKAKKLEEEIMVLQKILEERNRQLEAFAADSEKVILFNMYLAKQLEKQRRVKKKKVFRLKFCLQAARSRTRKLQRIWERRDMALKESRKQLAALPNQNEDRHNIFETGFKIVVSMSLMALVLFRTG